MVRRWNAGLVAVPVILDRDILTVDPTTFGDTVVLSTWLDGRLVHEGPPVPPPSGESVADPNAARRLSVLTPLWPLPAPRASAWRIGDVAVIGGGRRPDCACFRRLFGGRKRPGWAGRVQGRRCSSCV